MLSDLVVLLFRDGWVGAPWRRWPPVGGWVYSLGRGLWDRGEVQFPLSLAEMFIFLLQNKSW